jgi:uracil-DNA glycosylase
MFTPENIGKITRESPSERTESSNDRFKEIIKKLTDSQISFVPKLHLLQNCLISTQPKVVIMGQDPYPGFCRVTKVDYACGPAFLVPDIVITCPPSLKNLFIELRSDIGCPQNIDFRTMKNKMKSWISQGVFLTNCALTRGKEGTYLDSHKMIWMEYSINFVKSLRCPIVFLGTEAWELSKYTMPGYPVFKLYHPVSRDNQFLGSKMFSKINKALEDIGEEKIKWF